MSDTDDEIPPGIESAFYAALWWAEHRPAGSGRMSYPAKKAALRTWWETSPLGKAVATPPISQDVDTGGNGRAQAVYVFGQQENVTIHNNRFKNIAEEDMKVSAVPKNPITNGHLHPADSVKYDTKYPGWGASPLQQLKSPVMIPVNTGYVQSSQMDVSYKSADPTSGKYAPRSVDEWRAICISNGIRPPDATYRAALQIHDEITWVKPSPGPRFRCSCPSCPPRAPVAATAAPTCYTCGVKMRAVP